MAALDGRELSRSMSDFKLGDKGRNANSPGLTPWVKLWVLGIHPGALLIYFCLLTKHILYKDPGKVIVRYNCSNGAYIGVMRESITVIYDHRILFIERM